MQQFNVSPEQPGGIKPEDQQPISERAALVSNARRYLQNVMVATKQVAVASQPSEVPSQAPIIKETVPGVVSNEPSSQMADDARAALEEIYGNAA